MSNGRLTRLVVLALTLIAVLIILGCFVVILTKRVSDGAIDNMLTNLMLIAATAAGGVAALLAKSDNHHPAMPVTIENKPDDAVPVKEVEDK